jgi:outer membrane receptor protein involved in Fe transport
MRSRIIWLAVAVCLGIGASAAAQGNTTGSISGRISDQQGGVLPGVTVSATSVSLQGTRTAVTSEHGDYLLAFLPAGDYTVSIELAGFKTTTHAVKVASTQRLTVNQTLELEGLTERVVVNAPAPKTIGSSVAAASTMKQAVVDALPLNGGLDATVALAPGVLRNGVTSRTTGLGVLAIAGAPSYESLFLMNGVVLNENLRGQPISLYIEDAIEETTIVTSGVSAEFGRFTGGMVNAITKAGGNTFSGSMRTIFDNDDWRSRTPMNETKTDKLIPTYEYTFGGPVMRDRLWFFTAGRLVEETRAFQTQFGGLSWDRVRDEKRFEGKATYALDPSHTVRGSYLFRKTVTDGDAFSANILDLDSLTYRQDPEKLLGIGYNGIFGRSFFVEAQYASREGSSSGAGSRYTDMVRGTLLVDSQRGARYNSPTFCGVCRTEERDNSDILVKGSWFLSTGRWGSHNVVLGYDRFNDMRAADNHQSGSGYRILGTTAILRDGDVFPVFNNDGRSTIIQWNPILVTTEGSNFRVHSGFVNDAWHWTDRVTLNLGLRFDRNDGTDSTGATVSRDQKLSPRMGITWDPTGRRVWTVNGGYAVYASSLNTTIANGASIAGNPTTLQYAYTGPAINTDASAALMTREQAIQTVFNWFNANGGTTRPIVAVNLPGVNVGIPESLVSPSANELTGGVTRNLGTRAFVRVDAVYRDFNDFYATRADASTGRVMVDPLTLQQVTSGGRSLDVRVIETTNAVERRYAAMNSSFVWHVTPRLDVNAGYTLSRVWGNFDGENEASGPAAVQPAFYPEYREERWNYPSGTLLGDQRHKARVWSTWQVPVPQHYGGVTLGGLFSVDSGLGYGAVGTIDPSPYRTGLSYVTPVTAAQYYFTDRDAFRTPTSTRTDLAVTYEYRFGGPRRVTLFAKGEVLNVFDQSKLVNAFLVDQSILTASNAPTRFQRFNPFTETPVQGTHWDFGPQFGNANNRFAYQPPRAARFALGVKF